MQNAILNHNYSKENLDLQMKNENYRVVRTVTGEAKASYVLAIGGLSQSARKIFASSYDNMVQQARLKPNQAIINVVSEKRTNLFFYPIFARQVVHTTGTVIEFVDKSSEQNSQQIIEVGNESTFKLFGVYEDQKGNKGIIISLSKDGKHGKAIYTNTNTYANGCGYNDAVMKCETMGKGWRLPNKSELTIIFNLRAAINNAIKENNIYIPRVYQGDYWCADKTQLTYNLKTGKLKQRSSAYAAYLITILDF